MNIQFVDVNGNPLPAGILVTLTSSGAWIGAAALTAGGVYPAAPVNPGTTYTATFFGPTAAFAPLTFLCPPPTIIETESGAILTTESGAILVADSITLSVASSSAFTWSDWGARVKALFPKRWAGESAWNVTGTQTTNGRLGALVYGLIGGQQSAPSGLPFTWQQLQYAKAQCRMLTITDTNVDQVGVDWFGGVIPRVFQANGTESDRAYAARLVLTLTAGCPSIPGLTKVLQAYLNALIPLATPQPSLAADTSGALDLQGATDVVQVQPKPTIPPVGPDVGIGGLDTYGFTDVAPTLGVGIPTVVIFDKTSDPVTSAAIGLADPQFCIFLTWPGAATSLIHIASSITPAFDRIVRAFKAPGTIPVYATNGPS